MPTSGYNKKYRYFLTTINRRFPEHRILQSEPPYVRESDYSSKVLSDSDFSELMFLVNQARNSCVPNCTFEKTRRKAVRDVKRRYSHKLAENKLMGRDLKTTCIR